MRTLCIGMQIGTGNSFVTGKCLVLCLEIFHMKRKVMRVLELEAIKCGWKRKHEWCIKIIICPICHMQSVERQMKSKCWMLYVMCLLTTLFLNHFWMTHDVWITKHSNLTNKQNIHVECWMLISNNSPHFAGVKWRWAVQSSKRFHLFLFIDAVDLNNSNVIDFRLKCKVCGVFFSFYTLFLYIALYITCWI